MNFLGPMRSFNVKRTRSVQRDPSLQTDRQTHNLLLLHKDLISSGFMFSLYKINLFQEHKYLKISALLRNQPTFKHFLFCAFLT